MARRKKKAEAEQPAVQDASPEAIEQPIEQPQQESIQESIEEAITSPLQEAVQPEAPVPGVALFGNPSAQEFVKAAFQRILKLIQALGVQPDPSATQNLFDFNDPELHPVVLDIILTGCLGTEWWGWEPETFAHSIAELGKMGITISQENRDKLQAMSCLHVTNQPWLDWSVFEKITMALNGASPEFDHFEDVTPGMILVAIDILKNTNEYEISADVIKYIGAKFVEHGQIIYPLDEDKQAVNQVIYRLIQHDIDPDTFAGLLSLWDTFVQSNALHADASKVAELSEDDLADVQVLKAYCSYHYAKDVEKSMNDQLSSLATWAASVIGV